MAELLKECESARCPPLCAVFRKEKVALDLANPDLCDVLEVDLLVQPEPCEKHVSNGFIQPSLVDQLVFLGLAQYNRDIGTCTCTLYTVHCTLYNYLFAYEININLCGVSHGICEVQFSRCRTKILAHIISIQIS